eukprot:CAMPEP_0202959226 /NCGR_PEP_ID=MMETSP1396-20130829/3470_1 /ASSEMBLY_ACC=CAM_ASM_000872 /TAXON_ID= /ORGANISM="Pseudokeronopsis sp., Strain Brazil" /LENGTH=87 /DNA_ID=CAMNT_0049677697 /DNA_START=2076 /DNA_END=2339 /DNA_ORIENTATION=+
MATISIQTALEVWPDQAQPLYAIIFGNLQQLCLQKYSSLLVDKAIECASQENVMIFLSNFLKDQLFATVMKHQTKSVVLAKKLLDRL